MSDDTPKKRGPVLIELGDQPARPARPDPRPFAGEESSPQPEPRPLPRSDARTETRDGAPTP
ncbi:MAG: TIGR01620 family protein, partial [Paracoccus sp. (in: a-proteobacteria)]